MNMRFLFALVILLVWLVTDTSTGVNGTWVEPVCKHEVIKASEPIEVLPHPTPPTDDFKNDSKRLSDNRSWIKFKYRNIIHDVANRYDLDPQLIYATIMTESHGREYVYRFEPHLGEGSYCMGQILLSTARRLGFTGRPQQLFAPEICIDMIGRYHRLMLDTHGKLTAVQLARAYNTGSPYKRSRYGHINSFNDWLNETI